MSSTSQVLQTDVTRANFQTALPQIRQALQGCAFCAIDLEMTGLFVDGVREEFLDDVQDRYTKARESAAAYVITQFGLSCFRPVPGTPGVLEATTFNAYIFPEPSAAGDVPTRRFLADAGSLSFLASHNFDFNRWVREGVPYMAQREHAYRLQQFDRKAAEYASGDRREVIVDKEDDRAFVSALITQIQEWLATKEPTLLLGSMTSFQRLLVYQELSRWPAAVVVGKEVLEGGSAPAGEQAAAPHPGFFAAKVEVDGFPRIRLLRGTAADQAAHEAAELATRREALQQAAGFSEVLCAMRDSNKPVVGHNCWFDLLYVLASFATGPNDLPLRWKGFQALVAEWFPGGVYDTKHIAAQLPRVWTPQGTALGELYRSLGHPTAGSDLREEAGKVVTAAGLPGLPAIVHAPGSTKYEGVAPGEDAHEAGYDALMTGAVFAALAPLARATAINKAAGGANHGAGEAARPQEQQQPGDGQYAALGWVQQYKDRLNLVRTDIPYAPLKGPDPPVQRPHVLHLLVQGQQPRPMDIVRRLQDAGVPGRPRISVLPPAGVTSLGGFLVECDLPATAAALAAKGAQVPESQLSLGELAAQQVTQCIASAAQPHGQGEATDGKQQPTSIEGWAVQSYAAYASARAALLTAELPERAQGGGGRRGSRREGAGAGGGNNAGSKAAGASTAAAQQGGSSSGADDGNGGDAAGRRRKRARMEDGEAPPSGSPLKNFVKDNCSIS